jgi:hypothetical protein
VDVARREEILNSRAAVPDDVVRRDFAAETLVLNLGTGTYHGLDATGARLLDLLRETGGDVRLSIERLASEYGVASEEIAGDLLDFCAELADRGLLELSPL